MVAPGMPGYNSIGGDKTMKIVTWLQREILEEVQMSVGEIFGVSAETLKLDFPPETERGAHFTVKCFSLAKIVKKSPEHIASKIVETIKGKGNPLFESVVAVGPYLNIKVPPHAFFSSAIEASRRGFGASIMAGQGPTVMIEYVSPNTNKPLHLGHIRNGSLGIALVKIFRAVGYKVIAANLVNDRGVHICKSMLAYQKWGEASTPESLGMSGDAFVGRWYVRFAKEAANHPYLEEEAQEMLVHWEQGDSNVLALWKQMNSWVYEGFRETYRRFQWEFDVFFYESETYRYGVDLVKDGLQRGVFQVAEDGSVIAVLPEDKFPKDANAIPQRVTLLRKDGTSVYMTQDIYTAWLKVTKFGLHRSVYVVGDEQVEHFKRLFAILNMLGFEWSDRCFHLSYGMVNLPEGRMKSREGTVVDANDLLDKVTDLAKKRIREGLTPLPEVEVDRRAKTIAHGALTFFILNVTPHLTMEYDPNASLQIEGQTGAYCQYSYARCCSILRKVVVEGESPDYEQLGSEEEIQLVRLLLQFSDEVGRAAERMSPAIVARYVANLCLAFNRFYQECSIRYAPTGGLKVARLELTRSAACVIKEALALLNISVLEEM